MSFSKKCRKSILTGVEIRKKNTLNSNLQSILPETFKNDEFLTIFIFVIFYILAYLYIFSQGHTGAN